MRTDLNTKRSGRSRRLKRRCAFEQLIDMIIDRRLRDPGMHVYHYAPYEVTAMKRLMGRYGTRADELDQLLRAEVFVDLYGVVRKGLRAGIDSYSIKKLEHLLWARAKGRPSTGVPPSSRRRVRDRARRRCGCNPRHSRSCALV